MKESFKKYIWLILVVAIIVWFGVSSNHAEKERVLRESQIESARLVSTLPSGVEDAWLNYIKKQLFTNIQREDSSLKVRLTPFSGDSSYIYLSLNYPYMIHCDTKNLGISISFGEGEGSEIVYLSGILSSDLESEPERGVNPISIASKNLDAKLCREIAIYMATLTR